MAGGGSACDLARQGLGGPGDDPKDPPAQRLTVGRGGAVLSTKSRSSRENRSGLLGVRDVPGVVEDSRLPGSGRAPGPCAPPGSPGRARHDGRRARRPPNSPATLGVPAGVERRPRRHRVHPVQRQIHVAAGLQAFFNKTEPTGTGHGGRRALARSAHPGLRDRAADNAAGGTVATTSRALPVTPRSRHPLRGRRRSRRLRRRLSPTAEGSGPHRVGAASGHRPGPVVHRRFHRAVDEGHPRRCGHQGDYRRPDDDQRPISRGTLI